MELRTVSKRFICFGSACAGLTFAASKRGKGSRATLLRRSENDRGWWSETVEGDSLKRRRRVVAAQAPGRSRQSDIGSRCFTREASCTYSSDRRLSRSGCNARLPKRRLERVARGLISGDEQRERVDRISLRDDSHERASYGTRLTAGCRCLRVRRSSSRRCDARVPETTTHTRGTRVHHSGWAAPTRPRGES